MNILVDSTNCSLELVGIRTMGFGQDRELNPCKIDIELSGKEFAHVAFPLYEEFRNDLTSDGDHVTDEMGEKLLGTDLLPAVEQMKSNAIKFAHLIARYLDIELLSLMLDGTHGKDSYSFVITKLETIVFSSGGLVVVKCQGDRMTDTASV